MGAKVIIHRPNLTAEERAYRMEQLKQAVIKFHREVEHEKKKTNARN
jgi:hypothetical protein